MPQCKHYKICGRDSDGGTEIDLCILHSQNPDKNKQAFDEALDRHRSKRGDNFAYFVFPREIDFRGATFSQEANFHGTTFSQEANFHGTTFSQSAYFIGATFRQRAIFVGTTFSQSAHFMGATFRQRAIFAAATFGQEATFSQEVNFSGATFSQEADFTGAIFRQLVIFGHAKFLGRVFFSGWQEKNGLTVYIFANTKVDFSIVLLEPLDGLIMRDADLRQCRFLDTDLRKAEITGATWPKIGRRFGVYDEILEKGEACPWSRLEQLYRQLKQSYEDRRDYERAGDFHYGEKEMRRKNPQTPRSLRVFLTLYWAVSGYGERYLRPLGWAAALLISSTVLYLWLGLQGIWTGGQKSTLSMSHVGDWLQAAHYSFRTITFLKPEEIAIPVGYSRVIHTVQSLLGPLFLGLFALAVRQRLKR